MSTTAIVWIVVVVVVVAVIAAIVAKRVKQRRTQASARMGLPEIGALSGTTDSKVHAGDSGPAAHGPATHEAGRHEPAPKTAER